MEISSPTSSRPALRRLRPSILGLLLTGFVFALAPLVAALGLAAVYVDRLSQQSQVAVVQAVEAAQSGRQMLNQITAMERNIRQYLVLENELLLSVYRETHLLWSTTLERLALLSLADKQRDTLLQLKTTEQELFEQFGTPGANPQEHEQALEEFARLRELARRFLSQSTDWVDHEVDRLQTMAADTNRRLGWMLIAVIPTGLILAGIFTALIARPLRHMAQAIQRLGNEDFTTPAAIRGARDLEQLGERLEWLRLRLAELETQKTRFLQHVSHELKTPLASVREGAELLSEQIVGPLNPVQQEVASILRGNSLCLQRLIEDLLNFNQALSRHLPLRTEPVDLAALVTQVVESQQLAWRARNLRLDTALEPVWVPADREKLTTVVDNLISNAIKYSPDGGTIHLGLTVEDAQAQLSVRDQGPGFDPAEGEQVFEAFFQGRAAAAGRIRGSGLGLAIAREYAQAHDGCLVIGTEQSTGGCITLKLPLTRSGLA